MTVSFCCTLIFLLIISKKVPQLDSLKIYTSLSEERLTGKVCVKGQCLPGNCFEVLGWPTCLCPDGFISQGGRCTDKEKCHNIDCKPGICTVENNIEKCYCPSGFTVKDNNCIEITFKASNTLTTTLLLIIVAGSSVILTTLFGFCICYYYSQRNVIQ